MGSVKQWIWIATFFLTFNGGIIFAYDFTTKKSYKPEPPLKTMYYEDANTFYLMSGCFDSPCNIEVGKRIFMQLSEEFKEVDIGGKPETWRGVSQRSITFTGRTGDKTFDIEQSGWFSFTIGTHMNGPKEDKPVTRHLFFKSGDVVDIMPSDHPKCRGQENSAIKLRLVQMEGNQLTQQIILPPCMVVTK